MSILPLSFPYVQSISLRPGGEIYYKYRLSPLSKATASGNGVRQASKVSSDDVIYCVDSGSVVAVKSVAPRKRRVAPPLAVGENFTLNHSKLGKNGYGVQPEKFPKFSSRARRSIRWGSSAIEHEFGIGKCVFLTGTLPGSSPAALRAIACYSSLIVDRLNKWLVDNFSYQGVCYRLSVWELQKRGALHLHALVVSDSPIEYLQEIFQIYWIGMLEKLSDELGIDLFARGRGGSWRGRYDEVSRSGKLIRDVIAYAQYVEKSVSCYLSKYLGKGNGDKESEYYPARWWSMSKSVRLLISKQSITVGLPRVAESLIESCKESVLNAFKSIADKWAESVYTWRNSYGDVKSIHLGYVAWMDYDKAKVLFEDAVLLKLLESGDVQTDVWNNVYSDVPNNVLRDELTRLNKMCRRSHDAAAWELIRNPALQSSKWQQIIRSWFPDKPKISNPEKTDTPTQPNPTQLQFFPSV